tara:strand:+ start:893 stop:1882 length:990 start_codon:yes stop_codon:yes gene_type:complete
MYSFLTSLPAILGIIGFIAYLILRKSAANDPVINSILEKLKYEEPSYYKDILKLSPSEKAKVLTDDTKLRELVSNEDRKIINRVITNHYRTNIVVYFLCGLLVIVGIYLYAKPKPLKVDSIHIQNLDAKENDLVVDIDPIVVTWTSKGENGEVEVVLENIQTGKQTKRNRAMASDGSIKFLSDDYHNYDKILSNRLPNSTNRIRAIVYSRSESFQSKPYELKVGVKIVSYPEGPNIIKFNAVIDQIIIHNFHFAPKVALFREDGFQEKGIFEALEYSHEPYVRIDSIERYQIGNFILDINPREIVDDRIYRTNVQYFKEALRELKTKNL